MSAQCYEHRFGYSTNAKTCFNVHIGEILAEQRVLGSLFGLNTSSQVCWPIPTIPSFVRSYIISFFVSLHGGTNRNKESVHVDTCNPAWDQDISPGHDIPERHSGT